MVRRVPVVLDRGEATIDADHDWAGDCRLLAAVPDESPARVPRALFTRRMDCPGHLACSRRHPPSPPPLRSTVAPSFSLASSDSNAWARVHTRQGQLSPSEKADNFHMCLDVNRYPPSSCLTWWLRKNSGGSSADESTRCL